MYIFLQSHKSRTSTKNKEIEFQFPICFRITSLNTGLNLLHIGPQSNPFSRFIHWLACINLRNWVQTIHINSFLYLSPFQLTSLSKNVTFSQFTLCFSSGHKVHLSFFCSSRPFGAVSFCHNNVDLFPPHSALHIFHILLHKLHVSNPQVPHLFNIMSLWTDSLCALKKWSCLPLSYTTICLSSGISWRSLEDTGIGCWLLCGGNGHWNGQRLATNSEVWFQSWHSLSNRAFQLPTTACKYSGIHGLTFWYDVCKHWLRILPVISF